MENLVDNDDDEMVEITTSPLVTFPDDTPTPSEIGSPPVTSGIDTVKFEQKTMNNFKKTKVCILFEDSLNSL